MKTSIRSLLILACLSMLVVASGCSYGAISKIYATSGNDISLTEVRQPGEDTQACEYQKEPSVFVEKALQAASMVGTAVRTTTGLGEEAAAKEAPPCVAFTIHERLWFDAAEAVNVQEYLREEFGSGHSIRNVSLELYVGLFDSVINLATLGIANSITVEISGELYPRIR